MVQKRYDEFAQFLMAVQFKEISQAFEVLSDPKKRQIYDEGGEQAIKEGGSSDSMFHNPMDIFDMFFGGGMGSRHRGPQRGRDTVHPLSVTLEELYNGATRKLNVTKSVICDKCEGADLISFIYVHCIRPWR